MAIKNFKSAKKHGAGGQTPVILNKGDSPATLNAANYKWYRDPKIIGTVILIVAVAMQIFAFLEVPFFSTIHGYTVGLFIGYYNPLFYVFIMVLAAKMIFGTKLRPPAWFKVTQLEYLVLIFLVIYLGVSSGYYQSRSSWVEIGAAPWKVADSWLTDFTHDASSSLWYLPANTNGGALGVFLFAFVSMLTSGIGALFVALFALTIIFSILLTGKYFGLYRLLFTKVNRGKNIFKRQVAPSPDLKKEPLIRDEDPTSKGASEKKRESTKTLRERLQQAKTKLLSPADLNEQHLTTEQKLAKDEEDLPFDDPFK